MLTPTKPIGVLLLVLVMGLHSCKNNPKQDTDNKANKESKPTLVPFSDLLERYHNEWLALHPLEATQQGESKYNDQLPIDISRDYRRQLHNFYINYQQKLTHYDETELSADEKVSYNVLQWECEVNLAELKFPTHLMPLNQFSCLPLQLGQWAGGKSAQPFKTVNDYENWLARLKQFVLWVDTATANMQRGIIKDVVLPRELTQKLIPQIEALAVFPAEQNIFYTPCLKFPGKFNNPDKIYQETAYKMVIERDLLPALERMLKFLRGEYLPASRAESGVMAVNALGHKYYDLMIKKYTTTHLSADEIFDLGQKEVERLRAEIEKVKSDLGYNGDLVQFFNSVRSNPKLMPYSKPEEVLTHFNNIYETIEPNLNRLFDKTPKTPFEIRRTEAFREASSSAEYNQGSKDGKRPGIFYVPIPDAKKYNIFADEDLFLHEAIPGHHYQISLQQENTELPAFRQTLWYSAYGEGWALYAESLGKDLGLYTDKYQYLGMLSAEMHRAIRLVVDVGMHHKGWTREEAIVFSLENEAEPRESIVSEIERYMAIPGQALSYKIGQLKIIELRQMASDKLGDKFDIKEFHNVVLGCGCVPLKTLEAIVNQWVNQQLGSNESH